MNKLLECIFCNTSHDSLADLKEHSGTCGEHPAVKEVERLKGEIFEYQEQLSEVVSPETDDGTGRVWKEVVGGSEIPLMRCSPCLPDFIALLHNYAVDAAGKIVEFEQQLAAHRWIAIAERGPTKENGRILWGGVWSGVVSHECAGREMQPSWATHWIPIPPLPDRADVKPNLTP